MKVRKPDGLHCAWCNAPVPEDAETCHQCGRAFESQRKNTIPAARPAGRGRWQEILDRADAAVQRRGGTGAPEDLRQPQEAEPRAERDEALKLGSSLRRRIQGVSESVEGIQYYGFTPSGWRKVRPKLSEADVDLIRSKGLVVVPAGLVAGFIGLEGVSGIFRPAANAGVVLTPTQKFNYCAFQAYCVYKLLCRIDFFTRHGRRDEVLAGWKDGLAWLAAKVALGAADEADRRADEAASVMDRLEVEWQLFMDRLDADWQHPSEGAAMLAMSQAIADVVLVEHNPLFALLLAQSLVDMAVGDPTTAQPSSLSFVIESGMYNREDWTIPEAHSHESNAQPADVDRMAISRPLRWNDKEPVHVTDGIKHAGLTPAGWQKLRPMLSDAEVGLIRTKRLFVVPAGLLVAPAGRAIITGVCKPSREDGVVVLTPSQKLNYCAFEAFLVYGPICTRGFFTRQGRRQEVLAGWRNDLAWMAAKVALGSDVEADRRAPEAASVIDRLATAWERRVGKDENHRTDALREVARVIADAVLGEANYMFGATLLARLLMIEESSSTGADELSSYFALEPQILRQEDYAVSCFGKAPELEPQDHAGWHNRGNTLYELGRHEEAIRCYDKALELDPRSAPTWYGKGSGLHNLCRYDDALRCYDKALKLSPRDAATWHGKGCSLDSLGRCDEALDCYERALDFDAGFIRAWNSRGINLSRQELYDEAIFCFDQALDLDPRLTAALYCKGCCLFFSDCYDEAIDCLDKALELEPRYVLAWFYKGHAQEELDRPQDAVLSYKRFISLAPARNAEEVADAQERVRELEGN